MCSTFFNSIYTKSLHRVASYFHQVELFSTLSHQWTHLHLVTNNSMKTPSVKHGAGCIMLRNWQSHFKNRSLDYSTVGRYGIVDCAAIFNPVCSLCISILISDMFCAAMDPFGWATSPASIWVSSLQWKAWLHLREKAESSQDKGSAMGPDDVSIGTAAREQQLLQQR